MSNRVAVGDLGMSYGEKVRIVEIYANGILSVKFVGKGASKYPFDLMPQEFEPLSKLEAHRITRQDGSQVWQIVKKEQGKITATWGMSYETLAQAAEKIGQLEAGK